MWHAPAVKAAGRVDRLSAFLVASLLAACGVGTCDPSFEPVSPEQAGFMIVPRADGVAVECRDVEAERCKSMADSAPNRTDAFGEVERVVVSCVGGCTPRGGELRMDIVTENRTLLVANGGYGEFEPSCA